MDWNLGRAGDGLPIPDSSIARTKVLDAGRLQVVYCLGEMLGVFRLADAVVSKCMAGVVQPDSTETLVRAHRHLKQAAERPSPHERATAYARVLGMGDGTLAEGLRVNEAFPLLWHSLMEAATNLITYRAEGGAGDQPVLEGRVVDAVVALKANLAEAVTGLDHFIGESAFRALTESLDLLGDPWIVANLGAGTRKDLWSVIERLGREWLSLSLNLSAVRTLATEGMAMFKWIAEFERTPGRDDGLSTFLQSAEAWVLAESANSAHSVERAAPPE